jgi:hypothetical protein
MTEPISARIRRQLSQGRGIALQWIRAHVRRLKANRTTRLAEPAPLSDQLEPGSDPERIVLSHDELREVEERAIRRFCCELSSHSLQRRNELIQRKLLDMTMGDRPPLALQLTSCIPCHINASQVCVFGCHRSACIR